MADVGSPFPDFSLSDQAGRVWSNADLIGKRTVIYFYPKDDTSGCTTEACEFRDAIQAGWDVQVLGVSPDSAASHAKFAKKYDLPFPLLADTEHHLAEALGLWVEKSMYGRKYFGVDRSTFLINEQGVIAQVWRGVKPKGHAQEVVQAVT